MIVETVGCFSDPTAIFPGDLVMHQKGSKIVHATETTSY